jgi:hypothetical protein
MRQGVLFGRLFAKILLIVVRLQVKQELSQNMSMERDEIKALALQTAKILGEENEGPIHQLELILEHVGKDFLAEILAETQKIEENGGMMTDDGKRRRTMGGVFFYLAKGKIDARVRQLIFPSFGQKEKGRVLEWSERQKYLKDLLNMESAGEVKYLVVSLQGRPNQVVVQEASVIMTIAHQAAPMPFPRGVPQAPDDVTMYTVYMSNKHWESVKESLEKYKNDRLIIEGSQFLDTETNTIAILAINVTTKRMQKADRKEGEEGEEGKETAPKAAKPQNQKPQQSQKPQKNLPPKGKPGNPKQHSKPFIPQPPPPAPQFEIDLPEGLPADVAAKLRQLHSAAQTLRDRIADMESKGQAGVSMTKKLLQSTEKQIEALERQFIS